MALKDYEPSREQVRRIQARLNAQVEEIRNNRKFTDSARRAEIAAATLQARREVAALKAQFLATREARRESLEKRLFGILGTPDPTELMVLRDARDRAAAIGSEEEAATKLRLANQAGDTYMARAIAQVAVTRGWRDVVDTFSDSAELGTKTALEALSAIPSGRNTKIVDNSTFAIRNPSELGSANDGLLEVIARNDPAENSERVHS